MKEKLQEYALLAEIISAMAIIISLIFVGLQIRQSSEETAINSAAIRSQSSIAINDSLAHLNQALYADNELSEIWIRGRESLDDLDPVELIRFSAFVLERFNLAVYISELGRANAADVHIDWIGIMEREIQLYPGICAFVATANLDSNGLWDEEIKNCVKDN